MKSIWTSILLIASLLTAAVHAQTTVGRAIVDGQTVTLLSDGTWTFDTPALAGDCREIAFRIFFCAAGSPWFMTPSSNSEVQGEFRLDDRTYGSIIAEGIGTRDGATNTFYRRAVLENAAAYLQVDPAAIPVLDIYDVIFEDRTMETIVYQGNFDGLAVVYVNSIFLEETHSAQFLTWAIGTGFSNEHRRAHDTFLASFQIQD